VIGKVIGEDGGQGDIVADPAKTLFIYFASFILFFFLVSSFCVTGFSIFLSASGPVFTSCRYFLVLLFYFFFHTRACSHCLDGSAVRSFGRVGTAHERRS